MNQGARGANFERRVALILAGLGWYVTRAAGSHGVADLVGIGPQDVLFVQAKLGGPGRCSPRDWNALYELAIRYGGTPLLAHKPARGRVEFLRLTDLKRDRGKGGPRSPCELWEPFPALEGVA